MTQLKEKLFEFPPAHSGPISPTFSHQVAKPNRDAKLEKYKRKKMQKVGGAKKRREGNDSFYPYSFPFIQLDSRSPLP